MLSPPDSFGFEIEARDSESRARAGTLRTPHGTVETPNFIFCATRGAIKGLTMEQMRACGAEWVLGNTYHLMLQPGAQRVARLGGLHSMMQWDGPILTDSGGFQIFSLGHGWIADEIKGRRQLGGSGGAVRLSEEGADFRSYIDGSWHRLTPETSMEIQVALGADFVVVLDECTPFHVDRDYTARSMELSHRWALRSLDRFRSLGSERQALYGIVQGGVYEDLRTVSAEFVAAQPFFGQAVGGCLGATKDQMFEVVEWATRSLAPDRPTHLLGIGGITDLWRGVALGIDTFDCVHPTRLARHGGALCRPDLHQGKEHLNLRNAGFADDERPLDDSLPCRASRNYSRAYIHHLVKAGEPLGGQILAMHNVCFMMQTIFDIRKAIREGRFMETMNERLQH